MKKLQYPAVIMITLLICNNASAATLTDDENLSFARACITANEDNFSPPRPKGMGLLEHYTQVIINKQNGIEEYAVSNSSYWPSEILNINESGATIKTTVEIVFEYSKGGNKGWSKAEIVKEPVRFSCISDKVSKGEYPRPVLRIQHFDSGRLNIQSLIRARGGAFTCEINKCDRNGDAYYYQTISKSSSKYDTRGGANYFIIGYDAAYKYYANFLDE